MNASILQTTAILLQEKTEVPVSFSETLPDHLPDMRKILGTGCRLMRCEGVIDGDRVRVTSEGSLSILYIGEGKGQLKTAVFPVTLEKEFPLPADRSVNPTDRVSADCDMYAVNAVMTSPRTADCRAMALFRVSAVRRDFVDFDAFPHENACLREASVSSAVTEHYEETFDFSQDITLETDTPPVAELILPRFDLRLTSCRRTQTGFSFDGSLTFRTLCRAESTDEQTEADVFVLTKTFAAANDIHSDEAEDPSDVSLLPHAALIAESASISFDNYGENRIIRISAEYRLSVDTYRKRDVRYYEDAFCPGHESKPDFSVQLFDADAAVFDRTLRLSEHIPVDAGGMVDIADCRVKLLQPTTESTDGTAFFAARAEVQVLGKGENGVFMSQSAMIKLRAPMEDLPPLNRSSRMELSASLVNCGAMIRSGEIELEMTVDVSGVTVETGKISAISGIEIGETSDGGSAYIFYYPDADESLWDIARHFRVPPERVMAANNMESDRITASPLLIPCMA